MSKLGSSMRSSAEVFSNLDHDEPYYSYVMPCRIEVFVRSGHTLSWLSPVPPAQITARLREASVGGG